MKRRAVAVARRIGNRLPEPVRRLMKRLIAPLEYSRNVGNLLQGPRRVLDSGVRRPVSIVIPSYNDLPYLRACLRSIHETCAEFDYEVIIVDDFCQPANSAQLEELRAERVRVILKDSRLGFAGTVNVGMEAAQHDIVLLNSDIVALPGWLEALQCAAYMVDPRIGLVSPKLIYPNGRIQYGGTYWARLLAPQWFGHLWAGSPATRSTANVAGYNRSISGACAYLTRSAYERLGGLDQNFWLGFEDVDWGLRAWDLGIRCYYEPRSMLIHHESASRGYSQGARELSSMRYFWRLWSGRFLTARVTAPPRVDFVIGSGSSKLWAEHVQLTAESLTTHGHDVHLHRTGGPEPDEAIVAELEAVDSIRVAVDWTAGQTVWLASLPRGRAAYLLPGIESAAYRTDPRRQAWIVAHYRPEFDYIAPNRWVESQLRAEAAWESIARIPPAPLAVDPIDADDPEAIVTLGGSPEIVALIDKIAADTGCPAVHLEATDPSADIRERLVDVRPRVIVAMHEYDTSFPLLTLQALGVALVARADERIRYEIMDGFNALLVRDGNLTDLRRAVTDILDDAHVWRELRDNGLQTSARMADLYPKRLSRAFHDLADTAT